MIFLNDLKNFENSWPFASNFKSFSRLKEQFFLIVGQNTTLVTVFLILKNVPFCDVTIELVKDSVHCFDIIDMRLCKVSFVHP